MANETLLLDAAIAAGSGLVYAYVGRVTSRRKIGGEAQLAVALFSVWWFTLSAITATGAVTRLLAYGGVFDLGLHSTILHVAIVALVAAFWALEYYLVYLFTGSRRWLAPISVYYGVLYLAILYMIVWRQATGIDVVDGRVVWSYAHEVPRAAGAAIGIALIAPTIVGAIGYARLFFRVDDATQRYRIGLVSGTIILWFSTSLVAIGFGFSADAWWTQVSRFFGLVAALLILAAYRPPSFIRRKYGIEPVQEQTT